MGSNSILSFCHSVEIEERVEQLMTFAETIIVATPNANNMCNALKHIVFGCGVCAITMRHVP